MAKRIDNEGPSFSLSAPGRPTVYRNVRGTRQKQFLGRLRANLFFFGHVGFRPLSGMYTLTT
jgi:hypothetical protein